MVTSEKEENDLEKKTTSYHICGKCKKDSFQFMSSSLSDFANNLPKESFHNVENGFNSDALELIIKKESIPMIAWMVLVDSKRRSYRRKMNSILS